MVDKSLLGRDYGVTNFPRGPRGLPFAYFFMSV
jgi:hypothetical protein